MQSGDLVALRQKHLGKKGPVVLQGIALILFFFLVGAALAQYVLVRQFLRALAVPPPTGRWPEDRWPKVAVLLCIRGPDPFLAACLKALLHQDYPDYKLHIVVDSSADPAWDTVETVVRPYGEDRVQLMVLEQHHATCSLKCSSLVQALAQLDTSYQVIALIDADTIAHRTWLRELVAPLANEHIGATTGNRWYMPLSGTQGAPDENKPFGGNSPVPRQSQKSFSWASLLRYLWNINAAVQMTCFSIPWGGTLAIRRAIFGPSDLVDKWRHAFCEDTLLYAVLRNLGLRLEFVPQLIMVNREDCRAQGLIQWLRRQLLAARLYHPWWWGTFAHGCITAAAWFAAWATGIWSWIAAELSATAWAAAGIGAYIAILIAYIPCIERGVRRIVKQRGESTRWLNWRFVLALPVAAIGLQALYPAVLLATLGIRRVRWRGVDYHIGGPWKVRLLEYRPYREAHADETRLSL